MIFLHLTDFQVILSDSPFSCCRTPANTFDIAWSCEHPSLNLSLGVPRRAVPHLLLNLGCWTTQHPPSSPRFSLEQRQAWVSHWSITGLRPIYARALCWLLLEPTSLQLNCQTSLANHFSYHSPCACYPHPALDFKHLQYRQSHLLDDLKLRR